MISSGIKRGLAVSAVSALAVVGLPFAAHANTVTAQMDATHGDRTVTLYSQSTGLATVKSDGANATIRLEAGATSDISTVRFQYSTDAGVTWTTIASVGRNDNGAFSSEWSGTGAVGATVLLRAVGHSTVDGSDHDDARSVAVQAAGGAANAVSINDADQAGVYQSPITGDHNLIVAGTASAGSTDVSVLDANGNTGATESFAFGGGAFHGVLDISGVYDYDVPDQIVVGAENGTDDVESFALYKQTLDTVVATPAVANPATPATNTAVTVAVKDQNGKAIAGAQVTRIEAGVPTDLGFTNSGGTVASVQNVNDGTVTYLVNQTAIDGAHQPELGDIKTELTLGAGFSKSLAPSSDDGAAFDRDEYAGGDITVQVKDQSNSNFDNPDTQDLSYNWEITPFDPSIEPTTTSAASDTSDVAGMFDVNLPGGPSGTYELYASLSEGGTGHAISKTKIATYKVGQAAVVYDGGDLTIAPIHTTADVSGKLLLEDGTPLAGRKIALSFDLGSEYDEDGNTFEADAQIITDAVVTTSASGAFTLKVEDLAETETRTEIGGEVVADSVNVPAQGNWSDGNFRHGVDFVTDQLPAGAKVFVTYDNDTAGPAGTVQDLDIHVEDAFGDALAGVQVTLSLDHGFFVNDDDNSGYAAPAAGAYEWTPGSLGTTVKVSTNSSGNADADTSIGRDGGFDDDAKVAAKVDASVDGVSANDTITWSSDNPLAVSDVSLVRTPGQISPTPAGSGVEYDVYAKDQFGNPVRGVHVDVDCAVEVGDDDNCPADADTWDGESDLDDGGDLYLYADEAGTFTYTAVADNPVTRKFDASLDLDEVSVSDNATEEFYASVPTNFTIAAPSSVLVGSAATVKVKVTDQEGNPVSDLAVEFVRTGDPSLWSRSTNSQGEASYVFNRTSAGTENVTAVVRGFDDEILEELTAKVVFATSGAVAIAPKVTATSKGSNDVIKVNGPTKAKGARVTLYKIVGGKSLKVKATSLNTLGNANFSVADKNGSKLTAYKIVVSATTSTKRFVSKVVKTS